MNKKKTNYLVVILNIIATVSIYILYFSTDYLMSSIMTGKTGVKTYYNNFVINTLLNNIKLIMILIHSGIGIFNIICAIQNKKNIKLSFWQGTFGIYEIWTTVAILGFIDAYDIIVLGNMIISGMIIVILSIINIVLLKKNKSKPKIIQIILYIILIIITVLELLNIVSAYWNVVAIIMQMIYIHYQEKGIAESKSRKITNIILYYVLQSILSIGFFMIITYSLLISKINQINWENGLSKLYNDISALQGTTIKETYIPVENNYKYGFVNEKGQEKIACEYDRVSYFNKVKINNTVGYIALAKKDNKFYIISKSNDNITIDETLEKYLQTIDNNIYEGVTKDLNEDSKDRKGYMEAFEFLLRVFTQGKIELESQTFEQTNNSINLKKKDSKYYYSNENYSMQIEPIYDENEEYDDDYEYYDEGEEYDDDYEYYDESEEDEEDTYYLSAQITKYKVTIAKANGEIETSIVYLPGLDNEDATIDTFDNGYIEFENEEGTHVGWFDNNGNKTAIPNNYSIIDIKENKVSVQIFKKESENYDKNMKLQYAIIDTSGQTLLKTTALAVYDNIYLVMNENNKMVLMDKKLNVISKEYDKITTNRNIDIFTNFSSYQ